MPGIAHLMKTDPSLEKKGIKIDYGHIRVTIARSGGAHKQYSKRLEALLKPYRRQLDNETLSDEKSEQILKEAFVDTIIKNWETKIDDEFKVGIWPADAGQEVKDESKAKLLPVNKKNLLAVFELVPDLYLDLAEQSKKAALFRQDINEDELGN